MPDDKKPSTTTLPLDHAMKELLDLFDQCNEESPEHKKPHDTITNHLVPPEADINDHSKPNSTISRYKDSRNQNAMPNSSKQSTGLDRGNRFDGCETIEKLQQRQSELQIQLDEVVKVAKELDLKQKKKLNGLLRTDRSEQDSDDGSDDIELIEFHQIEIELRVSELNRQLSNIQEELRLRLYQRLQSKTSRSHNNGSSEEHLSKKTQPQSSLRRNSTQTDESTPPSSSCSDETNATSTADFIAHSSTKNSIESDLANQSDKINLSKSAEEFASQHTKDTRNFVDATSEDIPNSSNINEITKKNDLKSAFKSSGRQVAEVSALGSIPTSANDISSRTPSRIPTMANPLRRRINEDESPATKQNCPINNDSGTSNPGKIALNDQNNCYTTNDLERIEEGEEDDAEYYCNSEKFRSIYEEKISPMVQAAENEVPGPIELRQREDKRRTELPSHLVDTRITLTHATPSFKTTQDNRFNVNNVNSAKRGNRPLTIYMPRPDEELDLVETVQSLGHDLSILSSDLRVDTTSAQGYLYKSCSNNSKKWLKRYFLFDRVSKKLSYYENEEHLVKRSTNPKCTVSFEEISDVYVDHRLSEKQKGTTRNSFVFVLATIKRKYLLASSKAETMRAWIDILFTAAKANDYFQQIENSDESFNYDSFQEE